jgi:integrase
MQASGQRPEDARCKSSFEFRRSAVVHGARAGIKQGLADLDRARRDGDINRAAEAYNRVRVGLDTLRRYPPSTGSREADLQRSSSFKGPSQADPEHSNGKRDSLAGLPHDWQDKIQSEARDYDRPGLSIMALTGCRPAEARGAKVHQDDVSITIEIRGAKVDDDRGIKTRSISIEKSEIDQSQSGRDLQAWLGNREARTVAVQGSTEAFRERISRAADRAGLDQVSSYTYRHAEARELKNSGLGKEEIANRLGHGSERSQSVYG